MMGSRLRDFLATSMLAALLAVIVASPASADFGLKDLDLVLAEKDGTPALQAGSHLFALTATLNANTEPSPELGFEIPQGAVKGVRIANAPGLVGNPTAVPRCSSADFLTDNGHACPDTTAVGITTTTVAEPTPAGELTSAVYNLNPPPGVAAEIGFWTVVVPTTVDLIVNPNPPYNVIARVNNIPQVAPFYRSKVALWGVPASPAHDNERGFCAGVPLSCPIDIAERPFLTLPSSCTGPLPTTFEAESWEGALFKETVLTHDGSEPPSPVGMTGCDKLGFAPQVSAQPTTRSAESPTGMDFNLAFKDEGLTSPKGVAQATIEKAVVSLPRGMTLNPSAADGLVGCSEADLAKETVNSEPGQGCPQASKVGEVEVETPLLEGKLLRGAVYVATQDQNTLNTRFALYIVIKDPQLGINVKLAGKFEPSEQTGQVVTTFEDIPQFPFSHFRFHFREGPRSPLVTPPACSRYQTQVEMTPSSGAAPVTNTASFQVTSGVGGSSCPPAGVPPFEPGFEAGTTSNAASFYSPFYMRLTRSDGEQNMTRLDAVLPPGVSGKIAGVPKCPEAAIAASKLRTGKEELASPSCPAASQIGHVLAGAGVGNALTYVLGKVYLAGPFGGAPLSIVVVTPAVAGPFDVGTVVVRQALALDPNTAEVKVDGARSDPIPHILEGIPLKLRDLRVYVDRPNFTLNATSCTPKSVQATLFGSFADVFNPADDIPITRDSRYQAASCASLGFKPKLSLALKGGTRRGDHPSLRTTVTYPYPSGPGYANIGKAVVQLPPTEFIDNARIENPCTRVQFNANACPASSVLGTARATTPLLDEPLEGPVYFRSNGGERLLPDIVADLRGQFHFVAVVAVSSRNARLRARLLNAPDAPVTKFTLNLKGDKKGLLVNSANLCRATRRADVYLTGQNGRRYNTRPAVKTSCAKKGKAQP